MQAICLFISSHSLCRPVTGDLHTIYQTKAQIREMLSCRSEPKTYLSYVLTEKAQKADFKLNKGNNYEADHIPFILSPQQHLLKHKAIVKESHQHVWSELKVWLVPESLRAILNHCPPVERAVMLNVLATCCNCLNFSPVCRWPFTARPIRLQLTRKVRGVRLRQLVMCRWP